MIPRKDHYGQKESGFHRFSHHSHLTYRSQGSLQLDALVNQWKYCVFSNRGGLGRRHCIHHLHISHKAPYLPPPFSWVLQPSQEKLKTMLMQNFGGQVRCIMGDVQVANYGIEPLDLKPQRERRAGGSPGNEVAFTLNIVNTGNSTEPRC